MTVLDTSALVRFFTNDDKAKAAKVKQILESNEKLVVPDVVLPEVEYVLTKLYSTKKPQLIEIFHFLATHKHIKISPQAKVAINIFANSQLDMADSLILAVSLKGELLSFDQELIKMRQRYQTENS